MFSSPHLSTDHELFAWGNNKYGQCGTGSSNEIVGVPTNVSKISKDIGVNIISAGCKHSVVSTYRKRKWFVIYINVLHLTKYYIGNLQYITISMCLQ